MEWLNFFSFLKKQSKSQVKTSTMEIYLGKTKHLLFSLYSGIVKILDP